MNATMAALRRFISTFTNFTPKPGGFKTAKTFKLIATGVCLATGAGIAHYCNAIHNLRIALESDIGGRWLLSLPSVSAKDKAKTYGLDDGEMYMSSHEIRFRMFCTVEYEGQLFMTPLNFIESVTMSEPKKRRIWKSLSKQELENILENTPPVSNGTSNLFRNMRDQGIICYTEYLFLLCILTKPHAGFKIAFNMFDADGNQMVDKREFLVLKEILCKKKDKKEEKDESHLPDTLSQQLYGHREPHAQRVLRQEPSELEPRGMWDALKREASQVLFSDLVENFDEDMIDTTLLVHFFGNKGKAELNFKDFYSFMDNLQTEVLEIEFLSYSRGLPTISEEDFARILLRYTNVENISAHLENMRQSIPEEKGITFEEFRCFFQFLNNLEDFAIAMQMYNFANRSIGQDEFMRAVYVATGLKLTCHLVNTVFKIFDEDHDDKLSYKEFIGVMKDRLHRSERGFKVDAKFTSFKSCLKKELSGK